MTDRAELTPQASDALALAESIAYGGSTVDDGVVIDGSDPTRTATVDSGLDETQLNAFAEGTSSGLDQDIDPGEAFVAGTWVARDTTTTVTLPASSTTTVAVGYSPTSPDGIIVDIEANFTSQDPRISIHEFTTDGSSVTGSTDLRNIGSAIVFKHGDWPNVGDRIRAQANDVGGAEVSFVGFDASTGNEQILLRIRGEPGDEHVDIPVEYVLVEELRLNRLSSAPSLVTNQGALWVSDGTLAGTTDGDLMYSFDDGTQTNYTVDITAV